MSASILEQLRAEQEDVEILEKSVVKLLAESDKKQKHRILYENAIKSILNEVQDKCKLVLDIYRDEDGLKSDEIHMLGGQNSSGGSSRSHDVWTNFYDRIKGVKDYYRKFENLNAIVELKDPQTIADEALLAVEDGTGFAPSEKLGSLIDLNSFYNRYINLNKLQSYKLNEHRAAELSRLKKKSFDSEGKSLQESLPKMEPYSEIDYITFLRTFDRFHEIPRFCKYKEEDYLKYLEDLSAYLGIFFEKQNPLANHAKIKQQFDDFFREKWESKDLLGWETQTCRMPLYCAPDDKLFTSVGALNSHKSGKNFKKLLNKVVLNGLDNQEKLLQASRQLDEKLAYHECLIQRYKEFLGETIAKTIDELQKKQSKSSRELLEDEDDSGAEIDPAEFDNEANSDGSDEDEKPIYNPLNLPLGWDGKPIPYWLYKLHGLGIEYKCEICGNYSYWGRRAFERHFQEWRHAFGMRCLKIPNTVHFKEITKIEDAITLYEKLKKQADYRSFINEQEVECEDSQGNVMSARAYEDLRRQGLL